MCRIPFCGTSLRQLIWQTNHFNTNLKEREIIILQFFWTSNLRSAAPIAVQSSKVVDLCLPPTYAKKLNFIKYSVDRQKGSREDPQ